VDNVDNVCKGRKHVQGSEMRQPFGLFSMSFQDLNLIPRLSRPGKFDPKFHDFPGSVRTLYLEGQHEVILTATYHYIHHHAALTLTAM